MEQKFGESRELPPPYYGQQPPQGQNYPPIGFQATTAPYPPGPYPQQPGQPGGPQYVAYPPPQQPIFIQPASQPPPQHNVTNVVLVGGCPECHHGSFTSTPTCCGWVCGILFFPIGMLCCFTCCTEKTCDNCGNTMR